MGQKIESSFALLRLVFLEILVKPNEISGHFLHVGPREGSTRMDQNRGIIFNDAERDLIEPVQAYTRRYVDDTTSHICNIYICKI